MPSSDMVVVFVHGWSVTHTDTYGQLPVRLRDEAAAAGMNLRIQEIFLGQYISFRDEVRVPDIARAFQTAVMEQLGGTIGAGGRFVCITHSTGGPVIREWRRRYYEATPGGVCPMSHLIMLAPANFGSALAQLGKGRISRLKSWFNDVEPGQGVLDWLELGSAEAWDLNTAWIRSDGSQIGPKGIFPFVLTGQSIDRQLYDYLNSYTGETGSDGVVRVASANLNSTYVQVSQETPKRGGSGMTAGTLQVDAVSTAPRTALRIISGKSHAGKEMGIMRSVRQGSRDSKSRETITAILACLQVRTKSQYDALCARFEAETADVQRRELVEQETHLFRADAWYIHDRFAMVIFRVRDDEDNPVRDFDLILTAGPDSNPNHLPPGFFIDRQRNKVTPETITCYFNHAVMTGAPAVTKDDGSMLRNALPGADRLGFKVIARPGNGFVHYLPCESPATKELLEQTMRANSTTLFDIRLRRIVHKSVFRAVKMTDSTQPASFKNIKPGDEIVT